MVDKTKIRTLRAMGLSYTEIATEAGCTPSYVGDVLKEKNPNKVAAGIARRDKLLAQDPDFYTKLQARAKEARAK